MLIFIYKKKVDASLQLIPSLTEKEKHAKIYDLYKIIK